MDDKGQADEVTTAQGIDTATGFATDGEWPVNGRLRAEAMARAGVTNDPSGQISDELIAQTKERIEREDAEAKRAQAEEEKAKPSIRWTRDQLAAAAQPLGVAVTEDMDKAAILAAIEAAPTAQSKGA